MSQFREWFDYENSALILVFGMLAGAALPGLFALGIRLQAVGGGYVGGGNGQQKNPVLTALAWAIYGLVLALIIVALLFIARDFIAHHTGYPFLGAKVKK